MLIITFFRNMLIITGTDHIIGRPQSRSWLLRPLAKAQYFSGFPVSAYGPSSVSSASRILEIEFSVAQTAGTQTCREEEFFMYCFFIH